MGTHTVETTVPWMFSQAGAYHQWLWVTKDFAATLVCTDDVWSWSVTTTGAVPVSSGSANGFDTAAAQALEAVGKGFPDTAGYTRWTKAASRRYPLASGVTVDLASGEGKAVRVTLVDGRCLDGVLHLGDWLLHVVADGIQRDVDSRSVVRVDRLA